MEKRKIQQKEEQEENEKATLIQRKYREKIQARKEKEEKKIEEEQNEKASMIQKMYRAKKTKQGLIKKKHEEGRNIKVLINSRGK